MSRHTPLDHEYRRMEFKALMLKAQGNRNQRQFAHDIGMSYPYLNKFYLNDFEKPFSPMLLLKISDATSGTISYSSLLEASGYDSKKYDDIERDQIMKSFFDEEYICKRLLMKRDLDPYHLPKTNGYYKVFVATITTALAQKQYTWSGDNFDNDALDFRINLYNSPIKKWGFIFYDCGVFTWGTFSGGKPNNIIMSFEDRILYSNIEKGNKISLVVTENALQDKEFPKFLSQKRPLPLLGIYLSVIVINTTNLSIVSEDYFSTMLEPNNETPSII